MSRALGFRAPALAWLALCSSPALAYDAGTTHAGLTARAIAASSLPRRIAELFGLPGGMYETIRFDPSDERGRQLRLHLGAFDQIEGYAPDGDRLPALSWLVAGSVLEETPAQRRRNHFFDVTTGHGLSPAGGWTGAGHGMAAVASGLGSVKELFGGGFDGTGAASTDWLKSEANDLGLPRFLDARERAVASRGAAARETAMAESLLVAGGLLHVIEDAGDPAYVHNDFVVDLYTAGGPYERQVAATFGRLGLPAPAGDARPVAHLADLIHNASGDGLADRTARRFYSLGLVSPEKQGATAPKDLPPLVAGPENRGYLLDAQQHHIARFQRDERRNLQWTLDSRCYSDAATVLLPETAQAALSALEHLFRDPLVVDGTEVRNGSLALGAGKVTVLLEDAHGVRNVVSTTEVREVPADEKLADLPPGAAGIARHRAVVVFRGVDGAGEPIVTSVMTPAGPT